MVMAWSVVASTAVNGCDEALETEAHTAIAKRRMVTEQIAALDMVPTLKATAKMPGPCTL